MSLESLNKILQEAKIAIDEADSILVLDRIKSTYLGKKSVLTEGLKSLSQLAPEERPQFGQVVNEIKVELQNHVKARLEVLQAQKIFEKLAKETIDITLPGRGEVLGNLHPITQTMQRLEQFFILRGFELKTGPEIETEYYNFTALNVPENHPARAMHDTFYFADGTLLRTHTSNVQIHSMEHEDPPLRIISAGKVYRCDSDMTHTPMFHQLEGLVVEENANFVELKELVNSFLKDFFENAALKTRFRPSYFPFTEPSAEVDVCCVLCHGEGCRVCKDTGWLEVMGCGMVHPNVFKRVNIDSNVFSGYAFGMGVDRLAMLRYGIPDLRLLFENDKRFLEQF